MSIRQLSTLATLLVTTALHGAVPVDVPERVLLPLLTPPSFGAHGSEFRTLLTLENPTDTTVNIFGIRPACEGCFPEDLSGEVLTLAPHTAALPQYEGTPGRFLILEQGAFDSLAANLRVFDVSRDDQNFGTELPIVRERELTTSPVYLPGVPVAAGFRNTLRIYGTKPTSLRVTIGTQSTDVALTAGAGEFDPAYAISSAFPAASSGDAPTTTRVMVTPLDTTPDAARIWAFISVTNNTTQMITTITPQR